MEAKADGIPATAETLVTAGKPASAITLAAAGTPVAHECSLNDEINR